MGAFQPVAARDGDQGDVDRAMARHFDRAVADVSRRPRVDLRRREKFGGREIVAAARGILQTERGRRACFQLNGIRREAEIGQFDGYDGRLSGCCRRHRKG